MALHRIYPHMKGSRFANVPGEQSWKTAWHSIMMFFQSQLSRRQPCERLKNWVVPSNPQQLLTMPQQPRVTFIGHSTFLIEVAGLRILTDPIFYDLSYFFPRLTSPGLSIDQLPSIDAVLISHNHRDHMDEKSLQELFKHESCRYFVPQGDKAWFDAWGQNNVHQAMWWEQFTLTSPQTREPVTITFLPAWHWSQRSLFDHNKSLWGSWMISTADTTIYFAGDTAYSRHFKAIAHEFPSIDLALMPIGPCEPGHRMKKSHVSPEQSGQALMDLKPRHAVPMHWGVFGFGVDQPLAPVERYLSWLELNKKEISATTVHCMKIGETKEFSLSELVVPSQEMYVPNRSILEL